MSFSKNQDEIIIEKLKLLKEQYADENILHTDSENVDLLQRFYDIAKDLPFTGTDAFDDFISSTLDKLEDAEKWAEFITCHSSDGVKLDCKTPVLQYIYTNYFKEDNIPSSHKEQVVVLGLQYYFANKKSLYGEKKIFAYADNKENIEITSAMAALFLSNSNIRKQFLFTTPLPVTGYNNYDINVITDNEQFGLHYLENTSLKKKPIDKLKEDHFLYESNFDYKINHSRLQCAIYEGLGEGGLNLSNKVSSIQQLFEKDQLLDGINYFLDESFFPINGSFFTLENYIGDLLVMKAYLELYLDPNTQQNKINEIIKTIVTDHELIKKNKDEIQKRGILSSLEIKNKMIDEITKHLTAIPDLNTQDNIKTVLLMKTEKLFINHIKDLETLKSLLPWIIKFEHELSEEKTGIITEFLEKLKNLVQENKLAPNALKDILVSISQDVLDLSWSMLKNGKTKIITEFFDEFKNLYLASNDLMDRFLQDINNAALVHIAAHNGHVNVLQKLKELGADLDKANNNGSTPVFIAAQNGHVNVLQKLKELGANLDKANNNGATPAFIAAQNGHVNVLQKLKELGCNMPPSTFFTTTVAALKVFSLDKKQDIHKNFNELIKDKSDDECIQLSVLMIAQLMEHTECVDYIKKCIKENTSQPEILMMTLYGNNVYKSQANLSEPYF